MQIKLTLLLCFLATLLIAQETQSCYAELRAKGLRRLNSKIYAEAIDIFFRTRYCPDKPAKDDLDDLIKKTQDAWVQELEDARREAERQRQIAENSLDRVSRILSSMFYGNKLQTLNSLEASYLVYNTLQTALPYVEDSNQRLELRYQQARTLSDLKLYDLAIDLLDSIILEKPDYLFARQSRAVAYYYTNQTEACMAECEYLIEQGAFLFIAYFNQALCLARLGQYDEATSVMRTAQSYFTAGDIANYYIDDNVSNEIEQATGLETIYKDERAMEALIELCLSQFQAYNGDPKALYRLEQSQGDIPFYTYLNGINFLKLQVNTKPDDYGTEVIKAIYWEKAGYPDEAMAALAAFNKAHAQNQDARYNSFVEFAAEKQAQLEPQSMKRIALSPTVQAVGIAIRAKATEFSSTPEELVSLYQQAVQLDSNNFNYRANLMGLYDRMQEFDQLCQEATTVLDKWAGNSTAKYYLAICNYQQDTDIYKLEKTLEAILEADGYHLRTAILLSQVKEALGERKAAIDLLQKYLNLFPADTDVHRRIQELNSKN